MATSVPASGAAGQDYGGFAPASICYAPAQANETYADLATQPSRWTCGEPREVPDAARHIIRHDLRGTDQSVTDQSVNVPTGPGAQYLTFVRTNFAKLEVSVPDAAGQVASSTFAFSDLSIGPEGYDAFIELPRATARPLAIVLTVDASLSPESLVNAQVQAEPPVKLNAGLVHLIAALLCGLLLAPVLFDLGFHRTLRESFPLFHAMFCLAAAVQTASVSGLIPLVFDVSAQTETLIGFLSFDLMLVAMILFVRSFIEPDIITSWHRHMLAGAALLPMVANLLANFPDAVPPQMLVAAIYSCLGLMLITLFYVMAAAWRRGSRAVRYVTLAFAPLVTIGVLRITGALVPALYLEFSEMWAQNFALLFEVCVTAFAVANRFLTLKRERDNAVSEARSLETLSERDALTGLLNRRALESRFKALRAQGFTAMAVVDLDHFKTINDTYGHHVGDDVLIHAAHALAAHEDENLLAFRIGGEEFVLLLRGRRMLARAEERRRAITQVIARDTTVARRVTASMGFLDASPGAFADANFERLYERADRLLYEAKANGRDRIMAEKVTLFQRRLGERREDSRAT